MDGIEIFKSPLKNPPSPAAMPVYQKLEPSFYTRGDVVQISKDLLGKFLFTNIDGMLTGGMIVETEAYSGRNDKACHAHEKRTKRVEVMYEEGGKAYVYMCYGIHFLFNVATNVEGLADAVLIRAIEPFIGVDIMLSRRGLHIVTPQLTAGPGAMSQALGIQKQHYGTSLLGDLIWIEDRGIDIPEDQIIAGTRVGVAYAQEDAFKPWRFSIKGNRWVSKGKGVGVGVRD